MLGIAYAQRSPKGAARGSESYNLQRMYPHAWFSFQLFSVLAFQLPPPTPNSHIRFPLP